MQRLMYVVAAAVALAGCGGGGEGPQRDAEDARPKVDFESPPAPEGGAGGIDARLVASGFEEPTYVSGLPGQPDVLLVMERAGRVTAVRDGRRLPEPFLDLSDRVSTQGGEQGMFSIEFAPDYEDSGLLYVYFTDRSDDIRVVQLRISGDDPLRVDPGSARTTIRIHHPTKPPKGAPETEEDLRVHNGGQLRFGPDGMLYLGTGDAGGQRDPGERGQDTSILLAKILRIDPRPGGGYDVPRDNPFVGRRGIRPEIYAIGVRNPYRFSFIPGTRDLVIGDVGQNTVEEIDVLPASMAGANLGWSCYEGRERLKGCEVEDHLEPVIERPSSVVAKRCAAITGGFVVETDAVPALQGRYVYADFCEGMIRSARLNGTEPAEDDRPSGFTVPWPSSFGTDLEGRLYVTSYFRGEIYELVAQR